MPRGYALGMAALIASGGLLVGCSTKEALRAEAPGASPPSELERAWQGLADSIARSSEILAGPDVPDSALLQAEGYRYLTRLLNLGLSRYLHHGDPDFPTLGRLDLMAKFGGDNPDNLYQNAPIDGDATYRLRGTRGTVLYIEFTVGAGFPGIGENRVISRLDTTELDIAADGRFEIVLGPEPRSGNWLRTEPGVLGTLMVRQVFGDWENERRADFWIEREGSSRSGPPDLDELEMVSRLDELSHFLEVQSKLWVDYVMEVRNALPRNELPLPHPPARRSTRIAQLFQLRIFRDWSGRGVDRGSRRARCGLHGFPAHELLVRVAGLREPHHEPEWPSGPARSGWSDPPGGDGSRSRCAQLGRHVGSA